jgi:N-methylhydantoinase A
MGSNGGFMALNTARKFPVRTFLSGPVGGVIGAKKIASYSGIDNFITFDMGGTSTDVALVAGAMPKVSFSNQIGSYPTQAAQLDIQTIGAGGGSIASCDLDGGLDVGPQSAGAVPGPACYLRGGESATITDANVVLGRLPSKSELGGKLTLSREASLKAFGALANSSDETALAKLADGVIKIAVLKMAGAVREVSVHRGHDPREFYLLGFGGAGPMHVFLVAEELGVKNVLIPRFPGHLSALGQILADAQVHLVHAFAGGFGSIGNKQIQAAVQSLSDEAKTMLMADGLSLDNFSITAQVDVRYKGQSFTIPIPIAKPAEPEIDDVRQAFDKAHDATFGYCAPGQPIEVINVRLVGTVKSALPLIQFSAHEVRSAKEYYADVYWDGKWISTKVVQRDVLARNTRIDGPIIIAEQGSTTVVPPDWHLRVDNHGNLICHYEVHAR